ncbi:hypothetical protein GCM10010285_04360 [Streptomyces pseudogriseolus]|uniref:Knr4/Smi1-like domain-containing protein n=1 Tax=Streptomyces pseudogriseolus TaxID=36817 RepID=A0ABQ2SJX7_STREZ|nr:hypothetical protein GCM10010285_04360 [Streptomyces rubiginosus]
MDDNGFDWPAFLRRWRDEWVPSEEDAVELAEGDVTPDELRPVVSPASEAEVADAERRLGVRLPPSYREFLLAGNGWRLRDDSIYQLGAAHEIGWFGDPFGLTPMYRESLDERSTEQEVLLAGMWERALQLETGSDMSYVLLDPGDTDEDGEWALYVHKGWSGEYPTRYPSFRAYMQRRYESFHAERAQLPDFVNETTRARDADVERAAGGGAQRAVGGRTGAARRRAALRAAGSLGHAGPARRPGARRQERQLLRRARRRSALRGRTGARAGSRSCAAMPSRPARAAVRAGCRDRRRHPGGRRRDPRPGARRLLPLRAGR